MSKAPKHREPIINAAVRLFRRQGYSSTGLNDIVDASGAPKGSLYHYFPRGKVSIAIAAIEEAGFRVAETVTDLSRNSSTTGELLQSHAQLLSKWMEKSGFRDGCPITTVLLELAPQERDISKAGREAYGKRISILREKLLADGFTENRAKRLASLCTSAMQGALIQARIDRRGDALIVAAEELADMLEIMKQQSQLPH